MAGCSPRVCEQSGCGSCQIACMSCQTNCERCQNCQDACLKSCQRCQTKCEKSCQNCQGASCQTCQNCLNVGCQTTCQWHCQSTCEKSCQNCQGASCQTCQNCEGRCESTCEKSCQRCQGACQNTCETNYACQTYCENNCQNCEGSSCQSGGCQNCQDMCQRGVEGPDTLVLHFYENNNGNLGNITDRAVYKYYIENKEDGKYLVTIVVKLEVEGRVVNILKTHYTYAATQFYNNEYLSREDIIKYVPYGKSALIKINATNKTGRKSNELVFNFVNKIRSNAPIISLDKTDYGNKYEPFNIIYKIIDTDSKKVNLNVYINNNKVHSQTHTAYSNILTQSTFNVTQSMLNLVSLNTRSSIKFEVIDDSGSTSNITAYFTKITKPCVNCETASEKNNAPKVSLNVSSLYNDDDGTLVTPITANVIASDDNGIKSLMVGPVGGLNTKVDINNKLTISEKKNFYRDYFNDIPDGSATIRATVTDIYGKSSTVSKVIKFRRSINTELKIIGRENLGQVHSPFDIVFEIIDERFSNSYIYVYLNGSRLNVPISNFTKPGWSPINSHHRKITIDQNILNSIQLNRNNYITIKYENNTDNFRRLEKIVSFVRVAQCQNCEGRCESTCEKSCQTQCQLRCQSTCEKGCQSTCEKSCQTQCQLRCQNCEGRPCQGSCQTTIEKNKHISISDSDRDLGSKKSSFDIRYIVNNTKYSTIKNVNIKIAHNSNGTIIRENNYSNIKTGKNNSYNVEFDNNIKNNVKYKIIITATDNENARAIRTFTFTKIPLEEPDYAPTISGNDTDLGKKTNGFNISFSANDDKSKILKCAVKLNDIKILDIPELNINQIYNIEISDSEFIKLSNGLHTLIIEISDAKNNKAYRRYTFIKDSSELWYIHKIQTPTIAKKIKVYPNWFVADNAIGSVYVCNNANDENPTWEDMTNFIGKDKKIFYTFMNTVKEHSNYAVGIKIYINRNEATENSWLVGFNGSYEL